MIDYKKQTFVDGQVLTADCLNRMENGIKNACDATPPTCTEKDCSKVLSYGAGGYEWVDRITPHNGLSIYTINTDFGSDGSVMSAALIETNGREIMEGDLLLSPEGNIYRVDNYNPDDSTLSAVYVACIKGKPGIQGPAGQPGEKGDTGPAGITRDEKQIMLELFRAATYSTPMDDKVSELERLFGLVSTVEFYDTFGTGEFTGTLAYATGMTWGEFVSSEYNIHGFYFDSGYLRSANGYMVCGVIVGSGWSYVQTGILVGKYAEYEYDFAP